MFEATLRPNSLLSIQVLIVGVLTQFEVELEYALFAISKRDKYLAFFTWPFWDIPAFIGRYTSLPSPVGDNRVPDDGPSEFQKGNERPLDTFRTFFWSPTKDFRLQFQAFQDGVSAA